MGQICLLLRMIADVAIGRGESILEMLVHQEENRAGLGREIHIHGIERGLHQDILQAPHPFILVRVLLHQQRGWQLLRVLGEGYLWRRSCALVDIARALCYKPDPK